MVQNSQTSSLQALMAEGDSAIPESNNSAVTPVLTPTTTKLLTQLFESEDCLNKLHTIENDGFVVPLPPPPTTITATPSTNKTPLLNSRKSFVRLDSSTWQGGTTTVVTPTKSENLTILDAPPSSTMTMKTRSSSRAPKTMTFIASPPSPPAMAARKPTNKRTTPKSRPGVKGNTNEEELSPEEAERLRVRRERNKAAAARCRKRRLDQISTLAEEVNEHEAKKRELEDTIAQLKAQKEELEFILAQHQAECNLNVQDHIPMAIKSEPVVVEPIEQIYQVQKIPVTLNSINNAIEVRPVSTGGPKPKRPLTLNIASANEAKFNSVVEGVVIDTPSKMIASLGFDLMTSTGLTPTTNLVTPVSFSLSTPTAPSCSSQQRSSESVLTELNTPATENISLVSL